MIRAAAWWQKHKDFWVSVRAEWSALMKDKAEIKLTSKVDGELLYEKLDKLETQNLSASQLKEQVTAILGKYASANGQVQVASK